MMSTDLSFVIAVAIICLTWTVITIIKSKVYKYKRVTNTLKNVDGILTYIDENLTVIAAHNTNDNIIPSITNAKNHVNNAKRAINRVIE